MKLVYWVAECLGDSTCYSVRTRTKSEAVALVNQHGCPTDYGPVHKVTMDYDNALDLVRECLGECGGWWEA